MASVEEKVKQIIVEQLQVVMQFEEAFDLEIPDEDAEKIKNVKDAVEYIDKHAKAGK